MNGSKMALITSAAEIRVIKKQKTKKEKKRAAQSVYFLAGTSDGTSERRVGLRDWLPGGRAILGVHIIHRYLHTVQDLHCLHIQCSFFDHTLADVTT